VKGYIEKLVIEEFKSYGRQRIEIPLGEGFIIATSKALMAKNFPISYKAFKVSQADVREPMEGIPPRDLSPIKPVLVEGVRDRVRKGLVPLDAGGRSR
jgi:hypothetical protein